MNKRIFIILSICFIWLKLNSNAQASKIVGLVALKNESRYIENCLRALSVYTDAIIVLDDNSQDDSVTIVNSLKNECRIEKIICKSKSERDELADKMLLFKTGRECKGTHFIMIDADEMFSANCRKDNFLKNKILALKPGEALSLPLINLWKNIHFYTSLLLGNLPCIFCDDPKIPINEYQLLNIGISKKIHIPRIPKNFKINYLTQLDHVILHFNFVNWRNFVIKRIWYMCLEFICATDTDKIKVAQEINNTYNKTIFTSKHFDDKIQCSKNSWFEYPFFNPLVPYKDEHWRKDQILGWIKQYGRAYFKDLGIWELNIEDM